MPDIRTIMDNAVERTMALKKVSRFIRDHPGERVAVLPMTEVEKDALRTFLRGHSPGGRGVLAALARRLD